MTQEAFYLLIPSRDRTGLLEPLFILLAAGSALRRPVIPFVCDAGDIAHARSTLFKQAIKHSIANYDEPNPYVFFWDTDVSPHLQEQDAASKIAEHLKYAEEHDIDISYPYHRYDGSLLCWNNMLKPMSDSHFETLPDYTEVRNASLGFSYIRAWDYDFHLGGKTGYEDINYWEDNPRKPHVITSLKIWHRKLGWV